MHYDNFCDEKADCITADDEEYCPLLDVPMTIVTPTQGDSSYLACKSGEQFYHQRAICHYDTVHDQMMYCEDGTHLGDVGACHHVACFQTYKCLESYCIPIRKLCDGIIDCPNQEDEHDCRDFACPGHLKCHGQSFCVPTWELCDGTKQCPYGDDEKYCQICPEGCSCSGSVVSCMM